EGDGRRHRAAEHDAVEVVVMVRREQVRRTDGQGFASFHRETEAPIEQRAEEGTQGSVEPGKRHGGRSRGGGRRRGARGGHSAAVYSRFSGGARDDSGPPPRCARPPWWRTGGGGRRWPRSKGS